MHLPPPRLPWTALPEPVRAWVEGTLGGRVVAARSQPGGFSPGSADRIRTESGRRAFLKAVGASANPLSPDLHRREAAVHAILPADAPVPHLLAAYDDGEWVALLFEEVDGHEPALPWHPAELAAALEALDELAVLLTPAPPGAADLARDLAQAFGGWARLREDRAPLPARWMASSLDLLVELAEAGAAAARGNSLQHGDVRADNVLITPEGRAVLVDWPAAGAAAGWFDSFSLVANARVFDPVLDADALVAARPRLAGVDPDTLTGVLAGLVGYFVDGSRLPPPPGIPTVRAFQTLQGRELAEWLRLRLAVSAE